MAALVGVPYCEGRAVVVVLFGGAVLALDDAEFEAALQRGRELAFSPPSEQANGTMQIVDAAGAEAATGVPASWFLEAARRDDIPHLRLGKYVRFDLAEVCAAAKRKG